MKRNATSPIHRRPGWLPSFGPLLIMAALGSHPVSAQAASVRTACAGDVRTICAGVMPGGGRIRQCMIEKREQLSSACKDALAARAADGKK
jgi:hypothetical protein